MYQADKTLQHRQSLFSLNNLDQLLFRKLLFLPETAIFDFYNLRVGCPGVLSNGHNLQSFGEKN